MALATSMFGADHGFSRNHSSPQRSVARTRSPPATGSAARSAIPAIATLTCNLPAIMLNHQLLPSGSRPERPSLLGPTPIETPGSYESCDRLDEGRFFEHRDPSIDTIHCFIPLAAGQKVVDVALLLDGSSEHWVGRGRKRGGGVGGGERCFAIDVAESMVKKAGEVFGSCRTGG